MSSGQPQSRTPGCSAVNNEVGPEGWAANASDAAAKALAGGLMNSNCGGGLVSDTHVEAYRRTMVEKEIETDRRNVISRTFIRSLSFAFVRFASCLAHTPPLALSPSLSQVGHICDAIADGLTTEAELEARITRSLSLLMDTGLFDPLENQTFTKIGFDTINSNAAQFKNLEAARQGMVLLQNPATATTTAATAATATAASLASSSSLSSSSAAAAAAAIAATPILPLVPGVEAGGILLLGPHARTQKTLAGRKRREGVWKEIEEKG